MIKDNSISNETSKWIFLPLVVMLFFFVDLHSQTIIWGEDFETEAIGSQTGSGVGASTATWSSNSGAVTVQDIGGNQKLRASNANSAGIAWTTNPISILNYSDVEFSIDVDTGGGLDFGVDFFILEYRIDGGAYIEVENASGDNSPSDPIQSSYNVTGLSGNTLEFRIRYFNTVSAEYYDIDNILVQGDDQPPSVNGTGNQVYCPGTPIPVVETISITDPDDTTLIGISIQISSGYVSGEDTLTLTGSHPSITSSFSVTEGELTLTGPATLAEFEAAVSQVFYNSSGTNPTGTRNFSITAGNPNYLPFTGHYYEFIADAGISWTEARDAADARNFFGLQGYLATLTSQQEADFSGSQAQGVGWIGATDDTTEGDWQWVTGPEAGTSFWSGGVGGTELTFAFWNANEPNDYPDGPSNPGQENFAHITDPSVTSSPGSWNDLPNAGSGGAYAPQGYVVEYGDTPGDPTLNITATTSITIDNVNPTASNPSSVTVYCSGDVPTPDISVVIDEADNCTANPTVTFVSDTSNGGSNPETITRTYQIEDEQGNSINVTQNIIVELVSITTQPLNQTVIVGNNGTFTVATSNVNTFQWQVSINNGASFIDISNGSEYAGVTTNTLTVLSPDINKNNYQYRVVSSNSAASSCTDVISNSGILTMQVGNVITNKRITYRVRKN